ncbi:DUF192 domain-containing protein [Conexibacter sp. DBS9H8]|uniref:DUF192 domain-containing protein n=1 Tax=Conexibacter sp. DBS9H8 TaxID=2937801 RepID=UPI00200C2DE4|nr:DUF192 domain-containing protein [Conexibacter sp. DBS9H8]
MPRRELDGGLLIVTATDWRARLLGLAGLRRLPAGTGLELAVASIHTVGLRFGIDLIWRAVDGAVVRVDADVAPGRVRICSAARSVVEVNAGEADRFVDALTAAAPPD